ncbi:unnamed protein product [Dicrocoelium dendriticum]|nr:unnamed protein product [Dicrocoelium dendriticum]
MSIVQVDSNDGCTGVVGEPKVEEIRASIDGTQELSGFQAKASSSQGNFNSDTGASKSEDALSNLELNALAHFWDESVERKQYTEREITYNLLLRKLVDEFMDRTVTYSHQPKQLLNTLRSVLERNFPEFGASFHCERICAYLKACRRNAKKQRGEPFVRMSARYLSAGLATRMAEQMYVKEREMLSKSFATFPQSSDLSQIARSDHVNKQAISISPALVPILPLSVLPDITTSCKMPDKMSEKAAQPSVQFNLEQFGYQEPGMAELMMAKMLTQTAEFLLLTANRIEAGQSWFNDSTIHLNI